MMLKTKVVVLVRRGFTFRWVLFVIIGMVQRARHVRRDLVVSRLRHRDIGGATYVPVSYTHLTLPTIRLV